MTTECTRQPIVLQAGNDRTLVGPFNGGAICSDGGVILLKQVEQSTGILRQFAACFTDHRNPKLIDHTLSELIAQRVYALALGYEDLNDHDVLRRDLLLAALVGKKEPPAEPMAGKSTLNRREWTLVGADRNSRYKKIVVHRQDVDRFFVDAFIQSYNRPPRCIVLDLDATDDPVHGDVLFAAAEAGPTFLLMVRKVWVRLSQSYPYQALFRAIQENLTRSPRYQPLRCGKAGVGGGAYVDRETRRSTGRLEVCEDGPRRQAVAGRTADPASVRGAQQCPKGSPTHR